MRVLVTGATGFIGANLVRMLIARGFVVRIFRRKTSSTRVLEGLPVEVAIGALTNWEDISRAVKGCRQVYHLAGAYETGPGASERMFRCHVTGTRLLCEAALRHDVQRVVVCSSSVTLPFGPISAPAVEADSDPFEKTGIPYRVELRAYYEAKRSQERIGQLFVERGLEVVSVHPDFVLGPWDARPTSGTIIVTMARLPWVPFYPPGGKSFIGARDCVEGHILAMERGEPGARYLLGDHNMTFKDALTTIARVVGRPAPRYPLPNFVRSSARVAERRAGQRLPAVAQLSAYLDSLYLGRYRSPERARRELGLKSTPFEETVEEAYRWFRDNGFVS